MSNVSDVSTQAKATAKKSPKTASKKPTLKKTVAKQPAKQESVGYELVSNSDAFSLLERIVRVEESLKSLGESTNKRFEDMQRYMDKRFDMIDKRFEDMNKRFEDMQRYMDKRFNVMQWIMAGGFAGTWAVLGIMLSQL